MLCLYRYATDVNYIAAAPANSPATRAPEKSGSCSATVKVAFAEMFCEAEPEIDGAGGGDGGGEGSARTAVDTAVTATNPLDCKDVSSGAVFSVDETSTSVVLLKESTKT